MIHWMLVLFAGIGSPIPAMKTDLIFAERTPCFAYEMKLAQSNMDEENAAIKNMRENGKSQNDIATSMGWMSSQYPRGTCIPTTSAVTMK